MEPDSEEPVHHTATPPPLDVIPSTVSLRPEQQAAGERDAEQLEQDDVSDTLDQLNQHQSAPPSDATSVFSTTTTDNTDHPAATNSQSLLTTSSPSSSSSSTAHPAATTMTKLTPADFKPSALLGEGSYSQVYLVTSLLDSQQYAMKVLNKAHLQRHNRTTVAYAEKAALSRCTHPNIIRLYHTFQDTTSLYFILELCDGGDVASLIHDREGEGGEGGGLPHQLVVYYAAQLLHALHYLHHTAHIIHRDIKPDNLMLSTTGQLKLVDFGTAKLLDTPNTTQQPNTPNTATAPSPPHNNPKKHSFVGTAAYVAPEILTSTQPHSYAVDCWSAGASIYQLITGRLPFAAASEYLTFQRILSGSTLEWRDTEGSEGGRELVERLMERDETKRLGVRAEDWEEVKRMRVFEGVEWDRLDEWRVTAAVRQAGGGGKKYSVMSEESLIGWRGRGSNSKAGGGEEEKEEVRAAGGGDTPGRVGSSAEERRGERIVDSYHGNRLSVQREGRESESTDTQRADESKEERHPSHSQPGPTQHSASIGYSGSAPPSSFQSHLHAGETLVLCSAVRSTNRSSPLSCCLPWLSTSSAADTSSASHMLLTSAGRLLLVNLTTGECVSQRPVSSIRSMRCETQQAQSTAGTCDVLIVDGVRWQLVDGANGAEWLHAWQQACTAASGSVASPDMS